MSDVSLHRCFLVAILASEEVTNLNCESCCLLCADPGSRVTHVELCVTVPCGGRRCKYRNPKYTVNNVYVDVDHRIGVTHYLSYNVRRSTGAYIWKPRCCWSDPTHVDRYWDAGGVACFIDRTYERKDRHLIIGLKLPPEKARALYEFCDRQAFTTPECRESHYSYIGFVCMPFARCLRGLARCLGPLACCFRLCGEGRYPAVNTRTNTWTCSEFCAAALAAAGAIKLDVPACVTSPNYVVAVVEGTEGLPSIFAKSNALGDQGLAQMVDDEQFGVADDAEVGTDDEGDGAELV